MGYREERYYRDYFYWIYPLVILVLIIFAIRRDRYNREYSESSNSAFKIDSTITMNMRHGHFLELITKENSDSPFIYYTTIQDN
jgi:beta-lactamase regulating signal transducer with metallopeptidase domain